MDSSAYTGQRDTQHASASQGDIEQAQQQLKAQGLYNGQIDGLMGPQTRSALSKFQQENGLTQNSTLDQETKQKLSQANNNNGTQQQPQPQQPTPAPAQPQTPGTNDTH